MRLNELLVQGTARLHSHRCRGADAAREARHLLEFATGLSPVEMLSEPRRLIVPKVYQRYASLIARRLRHEPIERLTGVANFRGLKIAVSPATLIPRPATELIVEAALPYSRATNALVVDIGTGSGAIALAIADEAPNAKIIATDFSATALVAARRNARHLKLEKRVKFCRGNLLTPALKAIVRHRGPTVIIANLPYIPNKMMKTLAKEVRLHDPRGALVSGVDGLEHYIKLIKQLAEIWEPASGKKTSVFLECLPFQCQRLTKMLRTEWPHAAVEPIVNYDGIKIGVVARW